MKKKTSSGGNFAVKLSVKMKVFIVCNNGAQGWICLLGWIIEWGHQCYFAGTSKGFAGIFKGCVSTFSGFV